MYFELPPCSFLYPLPPMSLAHDAKRKAAPIVTFMPVLEKPMRVKPTLDILLHVVPPAKH